MTHRPRSRQAGLAALITIVLTLTTACSAFGPRSSVTIEEYEAQAEELGATLTDTVADIPRDPNGPDGSNDVTASSPRYVNAEGGAQQAHPWKYWVWRRSFHFAEDSGTTPEEVADRMAQIFEDEGWTVVEKDPGETIGTYRFSLPGDNNTIDWTAQIKFWHRVGMVSIQIVSPTTDASDGTSEEFAAAEFEDAATRMETTLDLLDRKVQNAKLAASFTGRKAEYHVGAQRWTAATTEIRTLIGHIRDSLHPASAVGPETPGDLR